MTLDRDTLIATIAADARINQIGLCATDVRTFLNALDRLGYRVVGPAEQAVLDVAPENDTAVRDLVIACGRMLDNWAEGDQAVRNDLWRKLHEAADRADDVFHIYPL